MPVCIIPDILDTLGNRNNTFNDNMFHLIMIRK